jgi:hypothetical protein
MIVSGRTQKNIIFHGNSLFSLEGGTLVDKGRYCETKTYNNIIASKTGYAATFLSFSGNATATKIANWSTQSEPVVTAGDIVVLWEITNDISAGGLTGQQAYDNYVTFAGLVRGVGAKIAVGTFIARDHAGDNGTVLSRGQDANTLIMANQSNFDLVMDIGSQSGYSLRADASGANYQADKLHLSTTGSDGVATYFANQLLTIL